MIRKLLLVIFLIIGIMTIVSMAGAAGSDFTVVVDSSDDVGEYSSMELTSSGNPVISYYDATSDNLKIAICSNPTCSSKTIRVLDSTGDVGAHTSVALRSNDLPVVAYYDSSNSALKLAVCNDATCGSVGRATIATFGYPRAPSLKLSGAGNPVIAYTNEYDNQLRLIACSDPTCAIRSDTVIESSVAGHPSLELNASSLPKITYYEGANMVLKLASCLDPACTMRIIGTLDDLPTNSSIWLYSRLTSLELNSSGYPVIAYAGPGDGVLKIKRCNDEYCSSSNTRTLDNVGVGHNVSMKLDSNDWPVISYQADRDLKLVRCYSTTCLTRENRIVVEENFGSEANWLDLNNLNTPFISYHEWDNGLQDGDMMLAIVPADIMVEAAATPTDPPPPHVAEAGSRNFTFTLNSRPTGNVQIPISVSDPSQCMVNYSNITLGGANWDSGTTVEVSGIVEDFDDGDRACNLYTGNPTSSDPAYDALTSTDSPNVGITIIDDDTAGVSVTPNPIPIINVPETGSQNFTFKLTSEPTSSVSFLIAVGSTARCKVNGTGFVTAVLDSSNWDTGYVATISGTVENIDDGDQICDVQTGDPSSSDPVYDALTLGDTPNFNVNIIDDDTAGFTLTADASPTDPPSPNVAEAGSRGYTFKLTSEPTAPVTIPISVSSSQCTADVPSVVLSNVNWNTGARVIVSGVVESIDDGDQPCNLVSGDPTSSDPVYNAKTSSDTPNQGITIIDDDGGITVTPSSNQNIDEASFRDFTYRLTSAPTDDVTIPLSTSSGQCSLNASSVVLGTGNWSTGAVVRVSGVPENVIDGNQTCNLISGDPTSTDPVYDILTASNSPDVNITILDDDVAGINLTPDSLPSIPTPPDVAEAGSRDFILTLDSIPSNPVTIPINVSDLSQCSNNVSSVVLDSGNWNTGAAVQISGVPEMIQDGNQPCTLITGDPTSGDWNYNVLNASDSPNITFNMIDDDTAGVSVTPSGTPAIPASPNVAEAGSREFNITLNTLPADDVVIFISVSVTSQCTVDYSLVTLTDTTWNTGFVVTVSGVIESITDGDQPCNLETGDVLSNDENYDALGAADTPDINITIIDDDLPETPTHTPTATPTDTPTPEPLEGDLEISKSDSPDPLDLGVTNELTYTITITNLGLSDPAESVEWSDTLPTGTTFGFLTPEPGWSCTTPPSGDKGTVTCGIEEMEPGTTATFILLVEVVPDYNGPNPMVNDAYVSSLSDPVEENNFTSASTTLIIPPTSTPTDTLTPSDTPTNTPTNSPTDTPTNTLTNTPTNTSTDTPTNTPTSTDTPTNTPTHTPTNTPTDTPSGPVALVVSAGCNVANLEVTITAGDGPFDITASAGINTPVLGVGLGTTTIIGPEKWDNLTVTEKSGNAQSVNLGQFKCRTDERPSLLTPAHRTRTTNRSPVFSWTPVSYASRYRIFLFDNKVVADRTVDIRQNTSGPETYMIINQPLPLGRLFWRIRGRTNRVWGLWSERFALFIDPPAVAPMTPVPTIDLGDGDPAPQIPPSPIIPPTFPPPPNSR